MGNNCKNGHPAFICPLIKKQCGVAVGGLLANSSLVPIKHTLAVDFGEVRAALRQATGNGGLLPQPSMHQGVIQFVQRNAGTGEGKDRMFLSLHEARTDCKLGGLITAL